jgi:hypothetical protein
MKNEKQQSNKFAFVGTPMSLNGPNPARTEYAFGTGNFDL